MSAFARMVEVAVPVSEGVYLSIRNELDTFGLRIGQWEVTLEDGNLVVKTFGAAINEAALLKVPA